MKKTLILMICLLLILSAVGCGGKKESPAAPAPEPTAAPTAVPTAAPTAAPTEEPTAEPTPEPTPEPTSEPTPEPTAEPSPAGPTPTPVAPGNYTYASPKGTWTVQLRADGLFTLVDPDGGLHTGEGWVTEADGTVTCGPTDIYFEEFAFNGGCSRWIVTGTECRPAER